MATLRRTVLAAAMISTGLLSTTGLALAGTTDCIDSSTGSSHGGSGGHGAGWGTSSSDHTRTEQDGLINSNGFKPDTNPAACNNNVPANVGGVQVPGQDIAGSLPLLSDAGHDAASPGIAQDCTNPAAS